MYVPKSFALNDRARVRALIEQFDFALLVTALQGCLQASHLPFVYEADEGPHGRLLAHMARANPQWRDFADLAAQKEEALVVFQGPHSYISPTWYGDEVPAVPTWNYAAVHAYGTPRIIDSFDGAKALLERLTERQEAGFATPWRLDNQKPGYIEGLMRGIVAFEIPVTRLQAKAKFGQNRTPRQSAGAIAGLEAAENTMQHQTAAWMRALAPDVS